MKHLLFACAIFSFVFMPVVVKAADIKSIETGYNNIESVAVDPETGVAYFSVVGEFGGKDGDGFIARLIPGAKKPEVFISELNGPMGSRIVGDNLYVVDPGAVLIINLNTRAIQRINIPGAEFLLDLAVSDAGEAFVTDGPANRIFKVSSGRAVLFAESSLLAVPNGIEVMPDGGLLVAGWGVVSDAESWKTSEAGRFTRLDQRGKVIWRSEPIANLDGLVSYQGRYIATGFDTGVLYSYNPDSHRISKLEPYGEGLADIDFYQSQMYRVNLTTSTLHISSDSSRPE